MKTKLLLILIAFWAGSALTAQNVGTIRYFGDGSTKEAQNDTTRLLVYFNKAEISIEDILSSYHVEKVIDLDMRKADTLYAFVVGIDNMAYNEKIEYLKGMSYVYDVEPVVGSRGITLSSNRFYVRLKSLADTNILKAMAAQTMATYEGAMLKDDDKWFLWYSLSTNKNTYNALEMSVIYGESGLFEAVDPDFIHPIRCNVPTPSDAMLFNQWSVRGCFDLWADSILGDGVNVAVIDGGVDVLHNEFSSLNTIASYDFIQGSMSIPAYVSGRHATEVAGVIFADHNNGDIAGIAPNVNLINISAFKTGYAYPAVMDAENIMNNLVSSFTYALLANADIILCPWDFVIDEVMVNYTALSTIINMAYTYGRQNKGTIVIFTSGNDNQQMPYPSGIDDRIFVTGASTQTHEREANSCYSDVLDFVAPGSNILTTTRYSNGSHGITTVSGTSMAAAHVAGVVALMLSANPDLTYSQVDWILKNTAYKSQNYTFGTYSTHPDGTWNNELGYGEVHVRDAVYLARDFATAPGLVVKDNSSDNGVEPTAYSATFSSPSIVAKDATNTYEVDRVSYGSLYNVNVTLHNYGSSSVTIDPADVKLYYHTYSTEQLTWPQSFPYGSYLTPSSTTPVTIAGNGGSQTFVITLDLRNILPANQTGTWYITFAAVIGDDPNEIHIFSGYNIPFDMFVEGNRLVAGKTYINYEEPHIIIDPILPPHPGINATPNPTDGHTTIGIDIDELPQNAMLVVTDMYGNVVVREMLSGTSQEVDLSGRPAGNYYVFVTAGDKMIGMNKIVVY